MRASAGAPNGASEVAWGVRTATVRNVAGYGRASPSPHPPPTPRPQEVPVYGTTFSTALASLTLALLAPTACTPASASPAQEDPRFELRSDLSHDCLGTDGSTLTLRGCDGSAGQVWMANDDGQFENVGTGVCLHSDEAGAVSVGECLDLPLLTWKPHTHDRVINSGTGFCLAAQDQGVSSSACGSGPSQTWTLIHRAP